MYDYIFAFVGGDTDKPSVAAGTILTAAKQLRPLADGGFDRYTLPVVGKRIDGNAVLELGDGAQAILDYFAGRGPKPEPEPT